ncbi:MAG: ABC transporter substrate-binding protein [Desulfobulbaceae bacterium]|nr:ABC transporter substrate-binding protein [Desulfobulbaceae bacterium]
MRKKNILNIIKKTVCSSLFLCIVLTSQTGYAKIYTVALFIPGQSPFWMLVTGFMQEAAHDLNIQLRVYDAQSDHVRMVRQVKEAVSGPNRVDAIVFQNFKKRAPRIIELAEKAEVYAYLFNSPIQPEENLGKPREKFKYWLGEMLPDDTRASEALAGLLIETAKKNKKIAPDGKVHIVGIGGRVADTASMARIQGLKAAVTAEDEAVLQQVVWTDWGSKQGETTCYGLLERYPEISVVWSASYKISNGILRAIRRTGKIPGKDIFTNSVGLTEDILHQIVNGEITATTGGHYIEGAWVLIQLYDYFHGIDFAEEGVSQRTPMPIVTRKNVAVFLQNITDDKLQKNNLRKIDFTRYSKYLNPGLAKYPFSLESIFSQLQNSLNN